MNMTLNNDYPTMCLFIDGHDWDHYLLFALTEINSGFYASTLGDDIKFQHRFLYVNASSPMVGGVTQAVFSANYESCHLFVGPGWTTKLAAIGEWAGLEHKPIVTGGATSVIFAQENFGYVSRTVPSNKNVLEAFVQIIVEYGLPSINIVYSNDDFGRSTAEMLLELKKDKFDVQLFRSLDFSDDVEGEINSVLDDLEASPTHATFLSMTFVSLRTFLNIAGGRGMHSSHLWLSPKATQIADELDPPPTGGIWGAREGEELTNGSPLAQRYLAKDPTPHIEAMQYGMNDRYDTLIYWGAYYYDAVLAAAHGLAAATNRSDGEEVLKKIRALSLDSASTGLLEMDENGDRIGARVPIFFLTPEGVAEKFAVYSNGAVEFLQDRVWPECQDLSCVDNYVEPTGIGAIVAGVLGGVVVLLVTVFLVYSKEQQRTLKETRIELDELKSRTHRSNIGATKYEDAVDYIDTLLDHNGSEINTEKLKLVKDCLIRGTGNGSMHIPQNLTAAENAYIMEEFTGNVTQKFDRRRIYSKQPQRSTMNFKSIVENITSSVQVSLPVECLDEFTKLDVSKQIKLFQLLSFSSLKQWDFNVFDVAAVDEQNTLLFLSWAVIFSPYSQTAMARELRAAGVEKSCMGLNIENFDGYDFFDLDLAIDDIKLINYIRLIQAGYKDNPYHNRIHAADVVQTLNSLLQMAGKNFNVDKEDLFFLLISAVVHDVCHPGRNNAFQVNSFSDFALNSNDISVLENVHVAHAFKCMLKDEDSNFICNTDPSKLHGMRKKIIEAVLHTDMSKHFASVSKIKASAAGKSWIDLEPDVQWAVLIYMLHMADISNPAKDGPMFKVWTDRCLDEFFAQGDKEREMGLPISPLCDRATTKRPDSQIGFIKFVVQPAFLVLADIIPGVSEHILPVIESNLAYWNNQKELEEFGKLDDCVENGKSLK